MDVTARVQDLLAIRGPDQRTPAWLAMRAELLTASDFGTALGHNPYDRQACKLVDSKSLARLPGHPRMRADAQRWAFVGAKYTGHGTRYEDEAVRKAAAFLGVRIHTGIPLIRVQDVPGHEHADRPDVHFLGASPDGITEDGAIVEVKCPVTRVIVPGVMPDMYADQVQGQMYCTGLRRAWFVDYRPGVGALEEQLNVVRVDWDPGWFANALPQFMGVRARIARARQAADRVRDAAVDVIASGIRTLRLRRDPGRTARDHFAMRSVMRGLADELEAAKTGVGWLLTPTGRPAKRACRRATPGAGDPGASRDHPPPACTLNL